MRLCSTNLDPVGEIVGVDGVVARLGGLSDLVQHTRVEVGETLAEDTQGMLFINQRVLFQSQTSGTDNERARSARESSPDTGFFHT